MVYRDPETGKFRSSGGVEGIENTDTIHFQHSYTVPASEVGGNVGQGFGEGASFQDQVLDFDQQMSRDEAARLLGANVSLLTYVTSTATEDGTIRAQVAATLGDTVPVRDPTTGYVSVEHQSGDFDIQSSDGNDWEDDADVIGGRTLLAVGHGPFSDSSTGMSGAGTVGEDRLDDWVPPYELIVDGSDELQVGGQIESSNVADAALNVEISGALHLGFGSWRDLR